MGGAISMCGQPFIVTARLLKGQGFEQFGVVQHSATNNLPGHSNQIVLAATAIRSATISHLCQSVNVLGVPMVITAGDGSTPLGATPPPVLRDPCFGQPALRPLLTGAVH